MESVKSAIHSIASTLTGSSTLTQSEPLGDSNIQCEDDNLSHETKNKLNLSEQSSTTDKEDVIREAAPEADKQALQAHDVLLQDIKQHVDPVPPAEQRSSTQGQNTRTSKDQQDDFIEQATGTSTSSARDTKDDAPTVASEIQAAAPEADPEAIIAHTKLVSEIESVVPHDSDQHKSVHELVDKVKVEEPAVIAAMPDPAPVVGRHDAASVPVHSEKQ